LAEEIGACSDGATLSVAGETVEALRAVFLSALLLGAALPTGGVVIRLARLSDRHFSSDRERWLLAIALGLGVQALALTLLGLAGLFHPAAVAGLPAVLAAATVLPSWKVLRASLRDCPPEDLSCHQEHSEPLSAKTPLGWISRLEGLLAYAAAAALAFLALSVVLSGLAPPTDYDGLLYHLVAPRTYLEHRAIVYIPHNFSANLPMFGEMLFAHGLAGGSDRAPQLIHAAGGVLVVALTGVFGRRLVGGRVAFWGAVGLAATPLVPFLATRAYIDLFTVLFCLIAVFGFLNWSSTGEPGWLRVAGIGAGFALSTKYAALTLLLVLGVAAILAGFSRTGQSQTRKDQVKGALWAGLTFGLPALLVALPWYARQVLVLGNPVWPMYFGGRDWDGMRVEQLTYFVSQYGSGTSMREWLLLPLNVYRESWRFGHVPDAFPPLLALAAPLAVAVRHPAVRWLLGIAAGATILWARGWQDLRFLLTIYPYLALLGAAGLFALAPRWRFGRVVISLGLGVLLLFTVHREAERALDRLPVLFGIETAQAYLLRSLEDHRAITYLNDTVPEGQSVLFLGDGQIWYCRMRCIPDPAHDNLLVWFHGTDGNRAGDLEHALALLRQEGVSHILLSKKDFWYLEHQDPEDRLKHQLASFYLFKARYMDLAYEDPLMEVYRGRW
jgi:hypothetical protein